ncbi:hypothetical protein BDV32DRAFT_123565 [Aspergillus pseudonomiae]|uniref:Uncharacterized protein n=1 Tax=Aspergillus pseudonomiae TaxID=1506151 RepID=A0A5N6I2V4_9EURO|nr:uncharacterized protein BDV37DRAFT_190959 [Aspergillus pseudonomiae]KAB8260099.1 hypothetical protein BDV32DRAFT_123565 [Aspergillus pseudonomiae]KAE8408203.1 hypothetical protein BDV37DRAFT_190959 [Aspergillus pseudonomiae]
MAHTFYDGTIPVVQSILTTLSHILQQASQQPNATALLSARLHEDMYPLTDQVRITTQFAANLVARLTGQSPVSFDGSPATYAECHGRIETVLKALQQADKDVVNRHADVVASTPMGPEKAVDMSAAVYAHTVALPNIYFHLTTAYAILRKEGVPLGKRDYYVGFFPGIRG